MGGKKGRKKSHFEVLGNGLPIAGLPGLGNELLEEFFFLLKKK